VVAQIVHEDRASKYNDDARCFYGQLSRDQRCGTYRGQAETAQTLANIGFVAAGAFGIGAATLLLLQQEAPKSPAASVRVDVGVLRLDVAGTF
jgi:hypothetical protein